jgi:NAD(P)-dependent dehydrogenase (short-subunit alcohol dehydrogenase family)
VSAPQGSLADSVAIVTGGANGIGAAIVRRLLQAEVRVAFFDVDDSGGQSLAAELAAGGDSVRFVSCDVTQEVAVARAVSGVVAEFGTVDILVNNAGRNAYFEATTMSGLAWDDLVAIDLKAMWLCAKHVLPIMREARSGSIVNIASIHGFATVRGMFPYAAMKAGVVGLTRSLALDYGLENIRVNAVCPGWIRTKPVEEWIAGQADPAATEAMVIERHPLRRIGKPHEVANLVAFLSSEEASYITGAAYLIDGGLTAQTV